MIIDYFEYFVHRHLKVCENVCVRNFYHNLYQICIMNNLTIMKMYTEKIVNKCTSYLKY